MMARWRVPLGFLAAVIAIVWARPTAHSIELGIPIAALGLLLRAFSAATICKNEQLATEGPYRYTRNPLYLGSTLLGFGFAMAAGRWELAVLVAAMLLGVYLPVIRGEEEYLSQRFGPAFTEYCRQVPRLLPQLRPALADNGSAFSWALYMRHREYRALIGFLLFVAVLTVLAAKNFCLICQWRR